jgi:hypothetical protein
MYVFVDAVAVQEVLQYSAVVVGLCCSTQPQLQICKYPTYYTHTNNAPILFMVVPYFVENHVVSFYVSTYVFEFLPFLEKAYDMSSVIVLLTTLFINDQNRYSLTFCGDKQRATQ